MSQIYIDDHPIDVDIESELRAFDWHRATWTADKLIAQSPFRNDITPSFYCYLRDTATARAGNWGDSGTGERGGFVSLLARLRGESESVTADYLRDQYDGGTPTDDEGNPVFNPTRLREPPAKPSPLPESVLDKAELGPSLYLFERGISAEAQYKYDVHESDNAVALPWRLPNGRLANIMYRSTSGKAFWYHRDGIPIRGLVYGINVAYREQWREVALVEAPIDALTFATADVPALAIGGASFNREKAEVIAMSPIESVIIVADNDKAGERWRKQAVELLRGRVRSVYNAWVPSGYKDVNDVILADGLENVASIVEEKSRCGGVRLDRTIS